ncbi:MAG TPA: ABC transporter permease [Chloroflexota bacterium]|jgi:osmoprotectant transport system permease protein|nr:ABC transporter permease [Chloroflexota bacterium]
MSEAVRRRSVAAVPAWRWLLSLAVVIVAVLLRSDLQRLGSWFADRFGDGAYWFITLPLWAAFPPFKYMSGPYLWPSVTSYFGVHLRLVVEAVLISTIVALIVGLIIHRVRWLYFPLFVLLDAVYTIPSLALFTLLLPFTKLMDATVLIPLVAYAQFILVRNVVAGLNGVPEDVKEAARGMGMSPMQVLRKVELPLALPVIAAGVRIATVASIGTAAIAALIAIPDLGALFFVAVQGGHHPFDSIEAGALAVVVLALSADLIFRVVERFIPANRVARAGRESRLVLVGGFLTPDPDQTVRNVSA